MKALVYEHDGQHTWKDVPDARIQEPTDIVVQVTATTICGSDLHILKGDVPEVTDGTILGHEAIGIVTEGGSSVRRVKPGDRVLVSCITSCGSCEQCRRQKYGLCTGGGGWILGHTIDGVQAEYARVPFADTSVYPVPEHLSDEQVLFLTDVLPTAFEVGVLAGRLAPGETMAVIGAGPIGIGVMMTAKLLSPSRIIALDMSDARLERSLTFGATDTVNNAGLTAVEILERIGLPDGVDLAVEAVGTPATFELAADLVAAGGRIANIGVHGKPATLHMERLWTRDITITMGLVDTHTIPQLLRLVQSGQLHPELLASHEFALADTTEAYEAFGNVAASNAMKVFMQAVPAAVPPAMAGAN
ncbi:MAG: Alcohol dehydrogenase GroES-like protein [Thermoleophilia bacterium]|nr:Alcohol dehydrogenase GroES-like protein [Thermoleophilia bacterium]